MERRATAGKRERVNPGAGVDGRSNMARKRAHGQVNACEVKMQVQSDQLVQIRTKV